nr:MAG TPA: hypothetical protein [Caudoviricetes sp.]
MYRWYRLSPTAIRILELNCYLKNERRLIRILYNNFI